MKSSNVAFDVKISRETRDLVTRRACSRVNSTGPPHRQAGAKAGMTRRIFIVRETKRPRGVRCTRS